MKHICHGCGAEFDEPILIDQGIGDCEYWGARSKHRDIVEVSPCCEEDYDIFDDEE
jgi:hypothetical protein